MRRNHPILVILFSSLILNATVISQTKSSETPSYPTVKNTIIKKFTLSAGRSEQQFVLTNGKPWNLALSIPKITKGQKVPLIIALHWAGEGNTYKEYSSCLAFPALEFMNGIIVAPSADGGHWLDPNNEKRVIRLVKQLIKYWPVDPQKVVVTGYSNGGIGSWFFAQKYPKLFTAGLPIAGNYRASLIKVPLYVLHGEKDDLFPWKPVEEAIKKSIEKGSKITYKSIPEYTHFSACSYTQELQRIAIEMYKDQEWE